MHDGILSFKRFIIIQPMITQQKKKKYTIYLSSHVVNYYKNRNKKANSYRKNEDISRWEAQINTWKLNWYASKFRKVFFNQNRINLCEHIVKMVPRGSLCKTVMWAQSLVCSHKIILFWPTKTSVKVEACQLNNFWVFF